LDNSPEAGPVPEELVEAILTDLNELIVSGKSLYELLPCAPLNLTRETLARAQSPRRGKDLELLNRVILEEAFPTVIVRVWDTLAGVFALAHEVDRTALCISGGGIRSATFGLGVLQGLARHGLLEQFDYLSTVSGGGYIGSWLTSWIHHLRSREQVFQQLGQVGPSSPTAPEPAPVRYLRQFSNYLTPKMGLFAADTWTLVGTYLRNLFLNWLVFIPLLLAVLTVPRLCVALLRQPTPWWLMAVVMGIGFAAAVLGVAYGSLQRPSLAGLLQSRSPFWRERGDQMSFLIYCCAPLFTAAFAFTAVWAWLPAQFFEMPALPLFIGIGAAVHCLGWLISAIVLKRFSFVEFLAVCITGGIGGGLLWPLGSLAFTNLTWPPPMEYYVCFAVPCFFGVFLLAATLFIGVTSRKTSDADREWWARMGAWLLIGICGWTLFTTLVIFGPVALWQLGPLVGSLGGLPGLFTILVGYNHQTPASKNEEGPTPLLTKILNVALAWAAPLFVVFLVAALSLGTTWLMGQFLDFKKTDHLNVVHDSPVWVVVLVGGAFAVFGWVMSHLINVNRFSLHDVYRNRLIRAYLGASNPNREPNAFTGFDPRDNVTMSQLELKPLHVVNMALNLVSGDNLAWQQRKAESFTLSPLHAGNSRLGYRVARHYAQYQRERGISLGMAVTISGAAASPNMGYHSSPVVALLMTLFNVRLGAWLGNPGSAGNATYKHPAPRAAALHFVKEALGLTDDQSPYVYLSDGGHFENLGLYEMVLRRCHYIVVSDAGCDPDCKLEDLGNAIRKIRVDLGIPIEMEKFQIRSYDEGKSEGRYCAVGRIDYSRVDGAAAKPGLLIYIKPAICGCEPKDVFNYSETNPDFPHESTSDQWFSESQFESYRMLGLCEVEALCGTNWARLRHEDAKLHPLATLVKRAYTYTDVPLPPEVAQRLQSFGIMETSPEAVRLNIA
jgi:hypothetical protein